MDREVWINLKKLDWKVGVKLDSLTGKCGGGGGGGGSSFQNLQVKKV